MKTAKLWRTPILCAPSPLRGEGLLKWILLMLMLFLWIAPAQATLQIFACEPEWGALAQELGGEHVSIYVATNALQDPHRIQAKPSLLARARSANLVVCTGAEL